MTCSVEKNAKGMKIAGKECQEILPGLPAVSAQGLHPALFMEPDWPRFWPSLFHCCLR